MNQSGILRSTVSSARITAREYKKNPLPHPGIYYGAYPYKRDVVRSGLDAILDGLSTRITAAKWTSRKNQDTFLNRVHAYDTEMASISDLSLDDEVESIRRQLRKQGFTEENTAVAFALIREIAGRQLGMRHFDCQLIGGWVMLNGMIAEMQTGEGKTLTATLAAGCAALAGIPVHVVTVNDYLVERDAALMEPVYRRLGLSVASVTQDKTTEQRQQAYRSDIVYCTSQQLTFDYLRDRLILKKFRSRLDFKLESLYSERPVRERLLMRGLNFAIVDEADSVFIDEARTPLILSSKTDNTQREEIHREAIWLAGQLKHNKHFTLDHRIKQVELMTMGRDFLAEIATGMNGIWRGNRQRNMLVEQALTALHLYQRDIHYLVEDEKVMIIDENTGRVMPDRTWEAGLHQMIEEKEGCEQSGDTETLGRISYQRFFRRYLRLSGMTGTASEVINELRSVYDLTVVTVPTNKPVQRNIYPECIYTNRVDKWQAVINSISREHGKGRPVLIGTRTVKDSEDLSVMLNTAGLRHQVLNARQDREEAEIIARAGMPGQITIATNMAGRGTDIKLTEDARQAGGLHVISCEKNISARIDRQLAGRCGRQGDPGSYQSLLSLEDTIVEEQLSLIAKLVLKLSGNSTRVKPLWLGALLIKSAQFLSEFNNRQIRKAMMNIDEKRGAMLAFSGKAE